MLCSIGLVISCSPFSREWKLSQNIFVNLYDTIEDRGPSDLLITSRELRKNFGPILH